jgi:nucleotidyltransferase/DNA polymerase involved in DNA repair
MTATANSTDRTLWGVDADGGELWTASRPLTLNLGGTPFDAYESASEHIQELFREGFAAFVRGESRDEVLAEVRGRIGGLSAVESVAVADGWAAAEEERRDRESYEADMAALPWSHGLAEDDSEVPF